MAKKTGESDAKYHIKLIDVVFFEELVTVQNTKKP